MTLPDSQSAKIMEIMDRLEHSPHGSDASMLRALNLLMQLQGPEGTVEVLRDGSQERTAGYHYGASVGGHWSAAHDALLHALSNGSVRIWGRKDGVAGSDFKTINSLDCCRIKFIEDRRGGTVGNRHGPVYKIVRSLERGNEVFGTCCDLKPERYLIFGHSKPNRPWSTLMPCFAKKRIG